MPTLGARLGKLDAEGVLIVMQEELQDLPINIEIYQKYAQDQLTKRVKKAIEEMSPHEISKELDLSLAKSEQIKSRVCEAFLLSDLVVFHKMSVNIVQRLYDFGYEKTAPSKLSSFAQKVKA